MNWAMRLAATSIVAFAFTHGVLRRSQAAEPEPFYRGKMLRIVVGVSPGGGYDLYARLLGRYLGRRLAGEPTVVVENMPGAGGYRAAQYVYSVAPKDGTTILLIVQTALVDAALGTQRNLDPMRFKWVGRLTSNVAVGTTRAAFGARDAQALREREAVFGASARGDTTDYVPRLLNRFAQTRIRIVPGYPGAAELALAMDRGEIDGHVGSWTALKTQRPAELAEHKVDVLFQVTLSRHRDLPTIPRIEDLATDAQGAAALRFIASSADVGRSIVAPPETPEARLALLRAAFEKAVADPALLQEVRELHIDLDPASGREMEAIAAQVAKTPADLLPAIRAALE